MLEFTAVASTCNSVSGKLALYLQMQGYVCRSQVVEYPELLPPPQKISKKMGTGYLGICELVRNSLSAPSMCSPRAPKSHREVSADIRW